MSKIRITFNSDVIIKILKLCIVLQQLLITNECISLTILLLISSISFINVLMSQLITIVNWKHLLQLEI